MAVFGMDEEDMRPFVSYFCVCWMESRSYVSCYNIMARSAAAIAIEQCNKK